MVFSQQFHFLDKEPFGSGCLICEMRYFCVVLLGFTIKTKCADDVVLLGDNEEILRAYTLTLLSNTEKLGLEVNIS